MDEQPKDYVDEFEKILKEEYSKLSLRSKLNVILANNVYKAIIVSALLGYLAGITSW